MERGSRQVKRMKRFGDEQRLRMMNRSENKRLRRSRHWGLKESELRSFGRFPVPVNSLALCEGFSQCHLIVFFHWSMKTLLFGRSANHPQILEFRILITWCCCKHLFNLLSHVIKPSCLIGVTQRTLERSCVMHKTPHQEGPASSCLTGKKLL